MRTLLLLSVAAMLAACGSGMSGEYGGGNCMYEKLSFKSDGTVYMTMMGMEQSMQYKVDGDKVSVGPGGQGIVFTKKGDLLEAAMPILGKVTCKKL